MRIDASGKFAAPLVPQSVCLSFDGTISARGHFLTAMHPVQSHVLEAIAYDESAHLLVARFRDSGKTVIYEDVPQDIYDGMIFADSLSSYFRDHIEGHFPKRHH